MLNNTLLNLLTGEIIMANNFGTGLNALHKVCKTAEEIDDDTFNITLSYEDIEAL